MADSEGEKEAQEGEETPAEASPGKAVTGRPNDLPIVTPALPNSTLSSRAAR